MRLLAAGYGAGSKDRRIPNVVRLMVGEADADEDSDDLTVDELIMLETNIDDMNPQLYDYVGTRLFAAGALDVFTQPVAMKKRPLKKPPLFRSSG